MATTIDPEARILELLRRTAGTSDVVSNPELRLYDRGLLDSLATVTLMAGLAEELGVEVSPAEFDREVWATPRRFVEDVARRLARR